MPKLALLDDRGPQRETISRLLGTVLPNGWTCIDVPLFETPAPYAGWLVTNDVQVLLVDYKLDEHAEEAESVAVDYRAPDVIRAIRNAIPTFPVFVLTAYPEDAQLQAHVGDAEAVIHRRTFSQDISVHVARMIRSANRFAEQHQKELAELSKLAAATAAGTATSSDIERMRALQTQIGLGVENAVSKDRVDLLADAEAKLARMEEIQRKIEDFLRQKK